MDPYVYKGLETESLYDKIDSFFNIYKNSENKEENDSVVFLLLGAAGSGKSIAL